MIKKVNYNKELFNPVFWHILHYLQNPKIRTIDVFGGSSAGKTYGAVQAVALDSYYNDYSVEFNQ